MDATSALRINKLRAGFLKSCPEDDQLKRMIKPYGDVATNDTLRKIYQDDDCNDLLVQLESPPILESYLSALTPRVQKPSETSQDSQSRRTGSFNGRESGSGSKGLVIKNSFKSPGPVGSKIGKSIEDISMSSMVSEGKQGEPRTEKKRDSKSLRRLRSIFRLQNGRDSNKTRERQLVVGHGVVKSAHHKRFGLYDNNEFGFEDVIDEDDDEEDNDELDTEANRRFFHGNESEHQGIVKPILSGNTDDTKAKLLKKGTILDSLSLNPQNLLHISEGRTHSSQRGDNVSVVSSKHGTRLSDNDDELMIDSFINGNDLDPLVLTGDVNADLTDDLSQKLSHDSRNNRSSQILSHVDESVEDSIWDEESSYGSSLLYSDSNDSPFPNRESDVFGGVPTGNSNVYLNNSIPSSHGFGLMIQKGETSSMFNTMGDSKKITPNSYHQQERLTISDASLTQEPKDSSTPSARRWSSGSTNAIKANKERDLTTAYSAAESLKSRTGKYYLHKQIRHQSLYMGYSGSPGTLTINKSPVQTIRAQESQLSSMLKSSGFTENTNPLEYFSIISGSNLAGSAVVQLEIYIQLSKTYRKKPFTITIKKSATAFEVLGYALYSYSILLKREDILNDGLDMEELKNPNYFTLKLVDEDGEPFEDNFGVLERTRMIGTLSDNEMVICHVENERQFMINEEVTPLPTGLVNNLESVTNSGLSKKSNDKLPMLTSATIPTSDKLVNVKVYMYPNISHKQNYANIKVSLEAKMNDILIQYCQRNTLNPNDYTLKHAGRNMLLDLNETVTSLGGQLLLEVIKKKDAKLNHFENPMPYGNIMPTNESSDLITPLTLDVGDQYIRVGDDPSPNEDISPQKNIGTKPSNVKKHHTFKLGINRQHSGIGMAHSIGGTGFFRTKNNSKTSINYNTSSSNALGAGSNYKDLIAGTYYKDLLAGAYYKYKVWRRQQVSFINKHERTLAIDGDYIYIIPPDDGYHWNQEVGKTKSFHISQVSLVKRSTRVSEYFKIFVMKANGEKRYYFEAISTDECIEIVTRLNNLVAAYKMNHKIK
ncbi:HHR085Cp [Eremothecium sinecaudum]|uniref:HHR085Cp n=1 Tax=Eremothecium sinecaudum TaxID=45286 RepID=A0A0X8HWR0_9SACH|nr:HHR085Cp [Eremothecium sinecaudum]AMD22854.1 HHR085Cp [Eremothecium sinecaudum]